MMKHRAAGKRLLSAIACFAILLSVITPVATGGADSGADTVRVGFFAFDGYHIQDEAGVRSGYGYEMLQHMAGYAGLRYKYVGYDQSWGEMQEMLANGEIDLLTSAQKTPEREERFDFSAANIGVFTAILTVKAGDTTFIESDYVNWDAMRVGMLSGNSHNDSFATFAGEKGLSYTPVYFNSADEMVAVLRFDGANKKIDAILTSNLRSIQDEWVLAQFDASPFYVMVWKGDAALHDRIDRAIAQLDLCEPGLRTRLMDKYYSVNNGSVVFFSPEECAYIADTREHPFTASSTTNLLPIRGTRTVRITGSSATSPGS